MSRCQRSLPALACLCGALAISTACRSNKKDAFTDHPQLTGKVTLQDVTFHSSSLNRDMQYRVISPATLPSGSKLPVVYLLHGGGGGFRDWSNYTDVARFAERGLILVMPEGDESYYTNSAEHPKNRYEDYIVKDLLADVQARFPASFAREGRAIVGVSMGGFGAIKLSFHHPELFGFVGGLSSAVDVPTRPFSLKRLGQWQYYRSIFGPWGSSTRRENDPFALMMSSDPTASPYFFLTCGDQEGLLPANRRLANSLQQRNFHYEFHVVSGGHNWTQWNARLDECFARLLEHLSLSQN